jgi:hypothetical protein
LDIVAFRGRDNLLQVVECKSYLDSRGVALNGFDGSDQKRAGRYKLLNSTDLREVVFGRLRQQLAESGACLPDATVKLSLACGRIASTRIARVCGSTSPLKVGNCGTNNGYATGYRVCQLGATRTRSLPSWPRCCSEARSIDGMAGGVEV